MVIDSERSKRPIINDSLMVAPRIVGYILLLCSAALLSSNIFASPMQRGGMILHFESQNKNIKHLDFIEDDDLQAEKSSFSLIEYSLMSNDLGDRWVLLTVKNNSDKKQGISDEHIVAVFADGKRRHANNFFEQVEGGSRLTQAIYFGRSNFPIVLVTMDPIK